jgi:hypothetical protein
MSISWLSGDYRRIYQESPLRTRIPPVPIIGETAYPLNLVCGAGRLWMDEQRAERDQG